MYVVSNHQVITLDQRSTAKREESLERIKKFSQAWDTEQVHLDPSLPPLTPRKKNAPPTSSWFGEFFILLERNLVDEFRNPETIAATLGQGIIITLLMGGLFWRLKLDADSVQNRIGVIFFMSVAQSMGTVMPTISVLPVQRQIIRRERAGGVSVTLNSRPTVPRHPFWRSIYLQCP